MEPYQNCEVREDCTFVVCLLKYPGKGYKLIDSNTKIQVFENGRLIAQVPVKPPGRKECDYCEVYHATFFKFGKDLESKFGLPKDSVPQILGSNISSKQDWKTWFEKLGIPKKYWNDPKGFFEYIAIELLKLTTAADEENRKTFDEIITKAYGDDEDYFWYAMLMNIGLTLFWYDVQGEITSWHENIHQAYRKMDKSDKKLARRILPKSLIQLQSTTEKLKEFTEQDKKEISFEFDALNIPFPVLTPTHQYNQGQGRPEDKGYNQFIFHFVGLLKQKLTTATNAQIFKVISLFVNAYLGRKDSPSKIKKVYLRS